jgi:hypothetical protein
MKTVLKVVLGVFVVLLLLVGGALYYVYTNIDVLVERGIETAGTSAAGTRVEVDSVDLDLLGGSATVRGFTLANPAGYSDAAMLSFDELAVVIDISGMSRDGSNIAITSITSRNPHLLYESHDGVSNLDTIRGRLASEPAPESTTPGREPNIEIGSVVIEGITATVSSDLMPSPADVNLGDVRLQNLSGTPMEVAQQVLQPLLTQLAANAGRIALTLIPEDFRTAGTAVRDAAGARVEQAGEAVGEATQGIREGLGNLLRRGEDAEDVEETADESTADQ